MLAAFQARDARGGLAKRRAQAPLPITLPIGVPKRRPVACDLPEVATGVAEAGLDPGLSRGACQLEIRQDPLLRHALPAFIDRGKQGMGFVFIGHDIQRDLPPAAAQVKHNTLAEARMELLHLAFQRAGGRPDEGIEGGLIEGFGFRAIPFSRPRGEQHGFGFAVPAHLNEPAVALQVADDGSRPDALAPLPAISEAGRGSFGSEDRGPPGQGRASRRRAADGNGTQLQRQLRRWRIRQRCTPAGRPWSTPRGRGVEDKIETHLLVHGLCVTIATRPAGGADSAGSGESHVAPRRLSLQAENLAHLWPHLKATVQNNSLKFKPGDTAARPRRRRKVVGVAPSRASSWLGKDHHGYRHDQHRDDGERQLKPFRGASGDDLHGAAIET